MNQAGSSSDKDHSSKLNYSEKLFMNRVMERKKKIDQAFNSISDTNNQLQISQALKLVQNVDERKELISKIIKRKKEIQKMKEINTINSLAPLFAKIKQKFFHNLYKKTGSQQHLLISQGKSANESLMNSQNTSRLQSDAENYEKDSNNEDSKQDENSNQTPLLPPPVNTPMIDQLSISKRQHLFNALTFLATRTEGNKNKTGLFKQQPGRLNSPDGSYINLGDNKLQYLTRDPTIFKVELQFNKDQKKLIEQSNSLENQGPKEQSDNIKNQKLKQNSQRIRSKVDNYNTHISYKNQILTNHTSLKNLLNYQNNQKKTAVFLSNRKMSSTSDQQNTKQTLSKFSTKNYGNDQDKIFIEDWEANANNKKESLKITTAANNKNSIFKNNSLKSNENSFAFNDYFSAENVEANEKKQQLESYSNDEFCSNGSNRPCMLNDNRRTFFNKQHEEEDEKIFINGLPKVSNFGGHYYYLGKKLPESHLYRFIIQCEQKRMYYKSDGNLFSNKPFTYDLNQINQISHIHKIIDTENNKIDILELKHREDSSSLTNRQANSLYMKMGSTPSSNKSHNKIQGFPSINQHGSFMTQRRQTDLSGNNSTKGNHLLNNTKDTESILSNQVPECLKPHILKGFYSPKTKLNLNEKLNKQYFVKVNYKK